VRGAIRTILHCHAESGLLRQRIAARRERGDASEADVDVLERLSRVAELPDDAELESTIDCDAGARRKRRPTGATLTAPAMTSVLRMVEKPDHRGDDQHGDERDDALPAPSARTLAPDTSSPCQPPHDLLW
jgi:hypothetical protein